MTARVAYFGARGDRRGLAAQAVGFCKYVQPERIIGVNMGALSPYNNDWWEYDSRRLRILNKGHLTAERLRPELRGLDVAFAAETMYWPFVTGVCAEMGIRTVVQVNYEFSSHIFAPDWSPTPDLLVAPTTWHLDDMPGAIHLPCPVDRERFAFRPRSEARTFLHVAGHPAVYDRAGTAIVFEALGFLEAPCHVIIRSQQPLDYPRRWPKCVEVEFRCEDVSDRAELYAEGDVLLLPRRYGGLSLVALEALSSGMAVLMTDAPPQNDWLPPEMLVPARSHRQWRSQVGMLPLYNSDPRVLAIHMTRLMENPAEVARLSAEADRLAEALSWAHWAPRYAALLEAVVS